MGLFGKKKSNDSKTDILENKHFLDELTMSVDVLLALSGNEQLSAQLRKIQEQLRYSNPTAHSMALALDKKISAAFGDMKIEMNKQRDWDDVKKLQTMLTEINMQLTERNVYANSKVKK